MASPFAAALAEADAALDKHMGETVQVTPMRESDFGRQADNERPAFDVIALVNEEEPSAAQIPSLKQRIVTGQWRVEIRRSVLGNRQIRINDDMILLDRPGSPRVKINMPLPDDMGRMIFVCGPTKD